MTFKKRYRPWNKGLKGITPWNKGKTKEDFPTFSNSGVKKGNIPWNKNKKLSKEHIKKLIISHKGQLSWCKGKKLSKEHIKKLSISHKGQKAWNKDLTSKTDNRVLFGKKHYNWQGGKSFEKYPEEFKHIKPIIRKRDNYTCQECKFTEKQLGKKLMVHHIDYNKKNNNPDNLICLCRSCHTQTNFKREDWTKYFEEKLL